MKRKRLEAKGKEPAAVVKSTSGSVIDESSKGGDEKTPGASSCVTVTHLEFPPPEYLLEEARKEPNCKLLQDYGEVISLLRDAKDFSFREIAEWLTENGVDADYNAVYRVYTKVGVQALNAPHTTAQERCW